MRAIVILLAALLAGPASAQQAPQSAAQAGDEPKSLLAISPIFGQLVVLSYPAKFTVPFEATNENRYVREAVPEGETPERWTQMITVTAAKGLAKNPNVAPPALAERLVAGFQKACPETFAGKPLGATKYDGHEAFLALASCGRVADPNGERSEAALLVVIEGAQDYYTIQWAERGAVRDSAIPDDDAKWLARYKSLGPIRLCPIVPGEAAPYPSCVAQN